MTNSAIITAIVLDLIVLGLLTFAIVRGYLKGFIKTAYHFVSWILAIVLTHFAYPYMVKLLKVSHVADAISRAFHNMISIPEMAGDAVKTISSLRIPDILKTRLIENNNYEVYNILGVNTLDEYVNAYLTNMVVNALAIVLTFILVILLIKVVAVLLEIVDHLPVVRQLNSLLGIVLGCANGVVYVWVFCLLLTLFGAITKFSFLYPGISQSLLTNWFYNHNLLLGSLLRIFA